jgi:hypothetical protein
MGAGGVDPLGPPFSGGGGDSFVWDPAPLPPQPGVPEASTWAMLIAGFAGLATRRAARRPGALMS